MRLIDADELMYRIRFIYHHIDDYNYNLLENIIDSAPTIEERKKGKWIKRGEHLYMCECGRFSTVQENYCPSCGSYNGEEKDNG